MEPSIMYSEKELRIERVRVKTRHHNSQHPTTTELFDSMVTLTDLERSDELVAQGAPGSMCPVSAGGTHVILSDIIGPVLDDMDSQPNTKTKPSFTKDGGAAQKSMTALKEAKQREKKQREEEKRKEYFLKMKNKLDKTLCKELGYYKRNEEKAQYKCPGAEQQVAWRETKCCTKCGEEKSLMVFSKNDCGSGNIIRKDGRRNRRPDCKACGENAKKSMDKAKACAKREGISYKAPEGTVCGVCNKLPTDSNRLAFDHHHGLDVFRGYCCNRCNIGMGILGDNVPSIVRTLRYMNKVEKIPMEKLMDMIKAD